jgi:tetratricopeptide (TPR) repeat protein
METQKDWFDLGVAYAKSGKYQEAIEVFQQAIRIKPDHANAHYNLGEVYLGLNDRNAAMEEYDILKNLDPQKADVLLNLILK